MYILKSLKDDSYYVGYTSNLEKRLIDHNNGLSSYTSGKCPWKLIHYESFQTKSEATKREMEIKKKKSKSILKNIY